MEIQTIIPFSLELAKKGEKVQTKGGEDVRIISFDRSDKEYPIIALIKRGKYPNYGFEDVRTYTIYGRNYVGNDNNDDLVIVRTTTKTESVNNNEDNRLFDINKAKEGCDVKTVSGDKVRIICWDAKDTSYPIIALVTDKDTGTEVVHRYSTNGKTNMDCNNMDLVTVPTFYKAWITLHKDSCGCLHVGDIYPTKNEAIAEYITNMRPYKTIRVEWEEW